MREGRATRSSVEVVARAFSTATGVHLRVTAHYGGHEKIVSTWVVNQAPVPDEVIAEVETVVSSVLEQLLDRRFGPQGDAGGEHFA